MPIDYVDEHGRPEEGFRVMPPAELQALGERPSQPPVQERELDREAWAAEFKRRLEERGVSRSR
jgi:hypothetical protein